MKHILQSLLMTTVLTLPTAFASDQMSAFDKSTTDALATPESNPQVKAQLEVQLTKDSFDNPALNAMKLKMLISTYKALVALINKYPTFTARQKLVEDLLPNATPIHIRDVADGLRILGLNYPAGSDEYNEYHHSAQTVYDGLTSYGGETPHDMIARASGFQGLVCGYFFTEPSKSVEYSERAAELYELAANHATATVRNILTAADELKFLGNNIYDGSVKSAERHGKARTLYELAANHATATVEDILYAANQLYLIGFESAPGSTKSEHYERAAALYEIAANRPTATVTDILRAASKLYSIHLRVSPGSAKCAEHNDRTAILYELAASRADATPDDILGAADELRNLKSKYYQRVAALYELAASRATATPTDILRAADGLKSLGRESLGSVESEYYQRAAALYELADSHRTATVTDILRAAEGLKALGSVCRGSAESEYYQRAAVLYKKSAHHQDATSSHIRDAANRLSLLGSELHQRADELTNALYERSAQHRRATFRDAANGLSLLGSELQQKAAELYELSARHPNATPDDIESAEKGLDKLGVQYYNRSAALLRMRSELLKTITQINKYCS
jgi:hypothetical protein